MNLLSTILDRLNQRIEVGNIFDKIYGLSELVGEGNDKAWAYYIGNGQAVPVTDFDAKQGTLFWAKRGKITVAKNDSLRLAGCKSIYETKFSMTAYAMVRKSHLPCDSADAQDWVASRVLRLISGTDPQFKTAIGVIAYEVVPNGYQNEIKYLPVNYEWAAVAIEVDVNVSTSSEDGCYDTCQTGDIPLPDFEPCEPCLTSVAVDGITITGNGTTADPLVAIGGGGGGSLAIRDEGNLVTANATTLNFRGGGVDAVLFSPGVVNVNVQETTLNEGVGIDITGTHPNFTITNSLPDQVVSLADGTGIDVTGSYPNFTIANTAPDQVVSLTAGTGISTSGSYPNFTIDNTAPDQVVSLTAGTDISISGTYPSFTIASTAATGMQGGQASGTDTYTVSIPGVTSYGLNDAYAIGFTNANTGASTLNINGLGAVNIAKNNTVPIIGGDIASNQQFIAIYDGTNFQLLGVAPNQMFAYVTNADSVTINRGQPVYAFGATGDRMTVKLANNTSEATSSKTIGLVFSTSIAPNQKGYIITQGVLDGINTNAYTAGDTLYVGNSAGALTNVKPYAPNHYTRIGIVERANVGNGQIYVFVQNGAELEELADVDIITTTPVNNDLLTYVTGSPNLWKNRSLGTILGGATSQYVRGDGSLASFPTVPTIFKSTTDSAGLTGTTNQIAMSQLITGNTFTVGDIIKVQFRARKTGTTNAVSLRLYVNTTNSLTGATALALYTVNNFGQFERRLVVKSATNTETFITTVSVASDNATVINPASTTNIDWTVNQYLIFAIQQTTAGDTTTGSMYLIEKL